MTKRNTTRARNSLSITLLLLAATGCNLPFEIAHAYDTPEQVAQTEAAGTPDTASAQAIRAAAAAAAQAATAMPPQPWAIIADTLFRAAAIVAGSALKPGAKERMEKQA